MEVVRVKGQGLGQVMVPDLVQGKAVVSAAVYIVPALASLTHD